MGKPCRDYNCHREPGEDNICHNAPNLDPNNIPYEDVISLDTSSKEPYGDTIHLINSEEPHRNLNTEEEESYPDNHGLDTSDGEPDCGSLDNREEEPLFLDTLYGELIQDTQGESSQDMDQPSQDYTGHIEPCEDYTGYTEPSQDYTSYTEPCQDFISDQCPCRDNNSHMEEEPYQDTGELYNCHNVPYKDSDCHNEPYKAIVQEPYVDTNNGLGTELN